MSDIDGRFGTLRQASWTASALRARDRRRMVQPLPRREFDSFLAAFWSGYLMLLAGMSWWLLS